MLSIRAALLFVALFGLSAPGLAEDNAQGCGAEANCVPPVYVDPNRPVCEGAGCATEQHPAIECEGENCLPAEDNPVEACEGQDCPPAAMEAGPMEECEGEGCELAPPPE